MRKRLTILVLGVALGLAARGAKWAYDAATAAAGPPASTSPTNNPAKISAGPSDTAK